MKRKPRSEQPMRRLSVCPSCVECSEIVVCVAPPPTPIPHVCHCGCSHVEVDLIPVIPKKRKGANGRKKK